MNADLETSRDDLALIRTDLANERTLLAYGRTALMVAGSGVSLIEFISRSPVMVAFGWILVVIGFGVGVRGFVRFSRMNRRLHP